MKSMIYKQQLLKKDINVPTNEFVHHEVYNIIVGMEEFSEKYGFIPARYTLDRNSLKGEGPFQPKGQNLGTTLITNKKVFSPGEYVKLVGDAFDNLETLVRNIFGLTEVERSLAIDNSKEVTNGLRDYAEKCRIKIIDLEMKLQEINLRIKSSSKDHDEDKLKAKIDEKELAIKNLERDNKNLDKQLLQSEKNCQMYKNQLDEIDENYKKLLSNYYPRLDEIKNQQEQVIAEVEKMKKGVEYFPSMFRAEKVDKSRIVNQAHLLETKIEELATIIGKLRNSNKSLKAELKQRELLTLELTEVIEEYRNKYGALSRELKKAETDSKSQKSHDIKPSNSQAGSVASSGVLKPAKSSLSKTPIDSMQVSQDKSVKINESNQSLPPRQDKFLLSSHSRSDRRDENQISVDKSVRTPEKIDSMDRQPPQSVLLNVPTENRPRQFKTENHEPDPNDEIEEARAKAKTQISRPDVKIGQENIKKAQVLAQQNLSTKQ